MTEREMQSDNNRERRKIVKERDGNSNKEIRERDSNRE